MEFFTSVEYGQYIVHMRNSEHYYSRTFDLQRTNDLDELTDILISSIYSMMDEHVSNLRGVY